ncbi:MAG: S41 family peptidase [Fimbriimonadaceae bacterium]|jgi:carboxyl-terminal processing protease|nr:S41 family peptidase [Fimbriimonadaceae bacterium]
MKIIGKAVAVVLVVAFSFGIGFTFRDFWAGRPPSGAAFASLIGGKETKTPNEIFLENYTRILSSYSRELDPQKLQYAAFEGQVASLGDPHTNFFEPRLAESFTSETRGQLSGIGARLSDDPIGVKIMSVFKDGPADRGGLRASDVIIAVDGQKTDTLPVSDVVSKIRGEAGTKVTITVNRPGTATPLNLTITRQTVSVPTAEGKMLPDGVAYINISQFAETTQYQFHDLLDEFQAKKAKGLIIDLRSNPGGVLQTASAMLGYFFDNKKVVEMRGRQNAQVFTPRGRVKDLTMPIVILINEDSASASEIFAGVMREYNRATLVGEHTYGKGSVQQLHQAGADGSFLKITVAKYFLPSGKDISRKVDEDGAYVSGGIKADVEVAPQLDANWEFGTPGKDNQLDRALEILGQKQAK